MKFMLQFREYHTTGGQLCPVQSTIISDVDSKADAIKSFHQDWDCGSVEIVECTQIHLIGLLRLVRQACPTSATETQSCEN